MVTFIVNLVNLKNLHCGKTVRSESREHRSS